MNRYETVKDDLFSRFQSIVYPPLHQMAFSHTSHVIAYASLLARKRKEDLELALLAALLHDSTRFLNNRSKNHAAEAARFVQDYLKNFDLFTEEEIAAVSSAIAAHSDKKETGSSLQELLKDADTLAHLCEGETSKKEKERLKALSKELGFQP